jgi:hypothetical protein
MRWWWELETRDVYRQFGCKGHVQYCFSRVWENRRGGLP